MENENFDLEIYKELNKEVVFINSDNYLKYNRICKEIEYNHYTNIYQLYPNFHWLSYRDNYLDILNLSKKELEKHWLLIGRYENRTFIPKKNYRIIFLIIDSDDQEIYGFCRSVYKSYMNLFSNILCLFIRFKEDIEEEYFLNLNLNTLYIKGEEKYENIYFKTIKALEYIYLYLNFDYVIRTNLSSFWIFKNVLVYIENKEDKKDSIFGWKIKNTFEYISGTGIFIHRNLVGIIINYPEKTYEYDDINISQIFLLNKKKIFDSRLEYKNFVFILEEKTMYSINKKLENIPNNIVYFRVKSKHNRTILDNYILSYLLKKFYNLKPPNLH
jgi:hypothetical protein